MFVFSLQQQRQKGSFTTSNPNQEWRETGADLGADEEEGVDVRGSTEQTLVQDDGEHQPGAGQELVTHGQQEQHRIQDLGGDNPVRSGLESDGGLCGPTGPYQSKDSQFGVIDIKRLKMNYLQNL